MITDSQTNFLYFADTLKLKYPVFCSHFTTVLDKLNIEFEFLPNTKDIWAVDYMPIQVSEDDFIQFVYNPDYLRDTIKWSKTISDVDSICKSINVFPKKSAIILDGGNVIRVKNKVIMCNKVFIENPLFSEKALIKELQNVFNVDQLIFIPTDPTDFTGHADGMVRFYDENTVLINDYSKEDIHFQLSFRMALHNAGLEYIEISYNPYNNRKNQHANGAYLNFLQMKQGIIIPIFGIKEDEIVLKQFEKLYPGISIYAIDANEIAKEGGILNCITWNILK
jgi:agmatine deiminase